MRQNPIGRWIEDRLRSNPELERMVEERLQEMRVEQDLIALREKRGLSQARFGKLLGVSQPAVARMERGGRNWELRTLVRAAEVLGGRVVIDIVPKKRPATSRPGLRAAKRAPARSGSVRARR